MTDKMSIKEIINSIKDGEHSISVSPALENIKIRTQYAEAFVNEGGRKCDFIVNDLRLLIKNNRLNVRRTAVLSIGGADGNDVRHILETFPEMPGGVLLEWDDNFADKARQNSKVDNQRTIEVVTGDAGQKLDAALNKATSIGQIDALVVICLGVLHELPNRSLYYENDAIEFYSRILTHCKSVLIYCSEPCSQDDVPGSGSELVSLRFNGVPATELKFISDLIWNKLFNTTDYDKRFAPRSIPGGYDNYDVKMGRDVALEVIHKLIRFSNYGRFTHELQERLTSFNPTKIKERLCRDFNGLDCGISYESTAGFLDAYRHYKPRMRDESGYDCNEPLSHCRLIIRKLHQVSHVNIQDQIHISEVLGAYCEKVAEQTRHVKILGCGSPVDLTTVFLRVRLIPKDSHRIDNISVDDLVKDELGNRILLIGGAGSGKSTILQYIQFKSAASECTYFPLRATFRHLSSFKGSLDDWVVSTLKGQNGLSIEDFSRSPQSMGPRLLVLLDGLDEIGDQESQSLSQDVLRFSISHPYVRFIVTSRPEGFLSAQYSEFEKFELQALSEPDIRSYIEAVVPRNAREKVWNVIVGHPRIFDLATTPFLLALICAAHEEIGPRARQRATVFKSAIKYLLRVEDYDRGRELIGRDKKEELLYVLKFIAVRFFKLDYVDNFSRAEVLHNISILPGYQLQAEHILATIVEKTGLLQFDRDGYHFVHRSVWEYLVAEGCRDGDVAVFLDRANLRQWEEPIRLFVGLAPASEVPHILEQLWERNPTLTLRAMTETEKFPEDTLEKLYKNSEPDDKAKIIQELRRGVRGASGKKEKNRLLVDTANSIVHVEKDCENLINILNILEEHGGLEASDVVARVLDSSNIEKRIDRFVSDDSFMLQFVRVPGGDFDMGVDHLPGKSVDASEKPQHQVRLSGFWISKYLVVNKAYYGGFPYAVDHRNEYSDQDNQPVNQINWFEAMLFARWLGCDLPTDAEWEFAARSGGSDDVIFQDPEKMHQLAWHGENSGNRTHPVGTKSPNSLGIFDVAGNLREWCKDWFAERYYAECKELGIVTNPLGPKTGDKKVLRGGTFDWSLTNLRPTYRNFNTPNNRNHVTGFRLVIRDERIASFFGLGRDE